MKNLLVIGIVIVLLLAGGVGYYLYSQNSHKSNAPVMSTMRNGNTEQSGNIFSSIKDALSKSISLQCTFTDEQNHKTSAYIKAGAVRADITGSDPTQQYNSSSVIIKDKKMYMWDTVKKQGMTMVLTDWQGNQNGSSSQNGGAGDVMAALEKYKNNCKPAIVSDSLFTPPSDVTFQDHSKMMMPSMVMPSTVMPSGMNQQDMQKMMQQYQQHAPQGSTGY